MSKTPLWQAISNALREDMAEGRYRPGDKLPTEAELAERFGVNRHTIRHAISVLVEDGLVRTRRGSGAFVKGAPTDYPIGKRVRYHQNLRAAGRAPSKKVLHVETRPATAKEAARLDLEAGALITLRHSVSYGDHQAIALSISEFPEARLPGIGELMRRESSVTKALELAGIQDYTRASTRVRATLANATQALHLELREGAPLIYTTSMSVDQHGQKVEFGRTWFAGDRVTLTLEEDA
ncbi:phosphonate metabolism transcriptional regulator PhnF [Cognatishimia sp. D5M38]|uniref:Phosphonate metabolism transcriptional regulator PhnF n=1 Tax=Cognatishimia coralii TaxID=3083254 RepID=A0ABU8QIK8_9RHOB